MPQQIEKLPLKLLILSEFTPRGGPQGEPQSWNKTPYAGNPVRVTIDKETFGNIMQRLAGRISLTLPNRLGGQPEELSVTIPISGIKAFHPDSIVEAIPAMSEVMNIRQTVLDFRDGNIAYEEFKRELGQTEWGDAILGKIRSGATAQKSVETSPETGEEKHVVESPPAESGGKDIPLESILDMVEVPGEVEGTSPGSLDEAAVILERFISLISASASPGTEIDTRLASQVIDDLDGILSVQVNEVLKHPEFQRLEAVWRGLKFLVDRTDFREPIQIELLSTPKEELGAAFETKVYQPEYENIQEVPISIILADYEFDRSLQDVELLGDLAGKAEDLQVPFISAIGAEFLGLDTNAGLERLPYLKTLFSQPEYIKWTSFRQGEASRWVTLLFNRFLLRNPYGPGHAPGHEKIRTFGFSEALYGTSGQSYLWGSPVWALGSLLTASFVNTGWCTDITGVRGGGVVEDLPVYEFRTSDGQASQVPIEVLIPEARETEFSDSGIITLICKLNSDTAVIRSAPTTHIPERYPDAAETAMSVLRSLLPYQIFAGQISHYVSRIAGEIGQGQSTETLQRVFTESLTSLFTLAGGAPSETVDIKVKDSEENPDRYEVSLNIQPDRAGLRGIVPVALNILVRK